MRGFLQDSHSGRRSPEEGLRDLRPEVAGQRDRVKKSGAKQLDEYSKREAGNVSKSQVLSFRYVPH